MRTALSFLFVIEILGSAAPRLAGPTQVGGLICSDTTWDVGGSPYLVTVDAGGSIIVGCDAIL